MSNQCDCDEPCMAPMQELHEGADRSHLMCVLCGTSWMESDASIVDAVHDGNPLPEPHSHRWVSLRNGTEVCRDCNETRER